MPLTLLVWNVDHGSAAFIQTPSGKNISIDLGTHSDGFSPLKHLKDSGINQLDEVIITHPHLDHIEDVLNFDLLSPKVLQLPRHLTNDDIWAGNRKASQQTKEIIQKYIEINEGYNRRLPPQESPTLANNNGGVSIETFTPSSSATSNLNNHSIVSIVEYEGLKILIPGDNESPSWNELLARQDFRKAITGTNILVASHHGRESGFCAELFDYFTPYIVLVSDGRVQDTSVTNRYSTRATGWPVHSRSGKPSRKRYCITTRNDGAIAVEVTRTTSGPFLEILID